MTSTRAPKRAVEVPNLGGERIDEFDVDEVGGVEHVVASIWAQLALMWTVRSAAAASTLNSASACAAAAADNRQASSPRASLLLA